MPGPTIAPRARLCRETSKPARKPPPRSPQRTPRASIATHAFPKRQSRRGERARGARAPRSAGGRPAAVSSRGGKADAMGPTPRRTAEAAASDQVLAVFLKKDYSLEPLVAWDTLGMRGTCSAGFTLRAGGDSDQILPDPYELIHVQTMTPVAHLTWASVWAGVAAGAVERAQFFIRNAGRQASGQLPPGAPHYTKADRKSVV